MMKNEYTTPEMKLVLIQAANILNDSRENDNWEEDPWDNL